MITKKVFPIFNDVKGTLPEDCQVRGTRIEYRLCGILLYIKTFYLPEYYGLSSCIEPKIYI